MDSWGILNVDSAAIAISRDDTGSSFRRKQAMVKVLSLIKFLEPWGDNLCVSLSVSLVPIQLAQTKGASNYNILLSV